MAKKTSLWQQLGIAAVGITFASLPQLAANAVMINFSNVLSDPTLSSPGMGIGTGTLSGDAGSFVFSYMINYSGLSGPVTDGHFHNAPIGSSGPRVHNYDSIASNPIIGDWRFDDSSRPLTDALAQELINGNIYASFHTAMYPQGEVRGQFIATSVPESSSGLGLLALGAWGVVSHLKNKKNKQKSPLFCHSDVRIS